ncbi:hypothetical protein GCM10009771_05520 [Nesterenkonia flava]
MRLEALLHAPAEHSMHAQTARGWVDLAYEAAYGERYSAAAEAALKGLEAPGSTDPENRLMLLRILCGVYEMRGESDAAAPYLHKRIALLRELGRARQAQVEADLGGILLREPDRVEAEILATTAERLRPEGPSVELADVLSSLAVRRLHDEGPETALPLIEEACEHLVSLGKREPLAGARMFLAHAQLLAAQPEQARATADAVLAAPANRAVRGAMAMLRATVHHHADESEEALADAMNAAELYSACGVRKGAASAAALLAGIAAQLNQGDVSVLAWRVAVQQAELGEVAEARMLSLALGQQLLELHQHEEAETVLDSLSVRLAGTESEHSTRGRALMGLGHAVTQQKRPLEAMAHWAEAAGQFLAAHEVDEAARAHLAAGALAASLERVEVAREHYERGLQLADQGQDTDPLMLLQALHSLGHLLCRHEDPSGVDYLERALAVVNEHGTLWQRADITDTLARGLTALGEGTRAVASALEAADLFAEAQDEEAAADAEVFAATVLLQMGQPQEAEAMFRMAVAEHDSSAALQAQALEGRIEALRDLVDDLNVDDPGAAVRLAEAEEELAELKDQLATEGDPPQRP